MLTTRGKAAALLQFVGMQKNPQSKQVFFSFSFSFFFFFKLLLPGIIQTQDRILCNYKKLKLKKLLTKSEAQLHYAMAVSKTTMDSYCQKLWSCLLMLAWKQDIRALCCDMAGEPVYIHNTKTISVLLMLLSVQI